MKIALVRGRDFTAQDEQETKPVVMVNQTLARQFFPGGIKIGRRIRPGISVDEKPSRMREIVGIVADVKFQNLASEWLPTTYVPQSRIPIGRMTAIVRTAGDPSSLVRPTRRDCPLHRSGSSGDYNIKTVDEYLVALSQCHASTPCCSEFLPVWRLFSRLSGSTA